jgi:hypothetical protein
MSGAEKLLTARAVLDCHVPSARNSFHPFMLIGLCREAFIDQEVSYTCRNLLFYFFSFISFIAYLLYIIAFPLPFAFFG